jgi:molybdate transport system substrate-binding protein
MTLFPKLWIQCAALATLLTLPAHAAELTVSAASSLSNAMRDLGRDYERSHPGSKIVFNFGASGALLQQLAKGAPVDVFAAADQQTMDLAEHQGLVKAAERHNFAANELLVIVPADSAARLTTLPDLAVLHRIAIGNPASVPAGRYAVHALQAARLWPALEAKAITTQNVRQALDYVARGEVDAGFVYATDAALFKDKVRIALRVPLDVPISYPVAPLAASAHGAEARRFAAYLLSAPAQSVLAGYGFRPPQAH